MTVLSWDAGPTKCNTTVQMGTNTLLLFNPKGFSGTLFVHQDEKANYYFELPSYLFCTYVTCYTANALS